MTHADLRAVNTLKEQKAVAPKKAVGRGVKDGVLAAKTAAVFLPDDPAQPRLRAMA